MIVYLFQVALASFFDNDDGQGEEEVLDLPPPPAMPVQPPSQPPQAQPIAKPVAKKPKNTSRYSGFSYEELSSIYLINLFFQTLMISIISSVFISCTYILRPKKKRCLVPITLPYLVFVPYPKVFFANPTEK